MEIPISGDSPNTQSLEIGLQPSNCYALPEGMLLELLQEILPKLQRVLESSYALPEDMFLELTS